MTVKNNPIAYLQKDGFKISSDPNEYRESYPNGKRKPWGKRDLMQYGINADSYCGGYHRAYDLYREHNAPIKAIANALVAPGTGWNTFGWTLVLTFVDATGKHYQVIYGHLNKNPLDYLKVGQEVKQGQVVAYQGGSNNIGVSNMASHLHIQFQPYGALNEKAFTCNGIDPLNIDISKTSARPSSKPKASAPKAKAKPKVIKTHLIVAGHGGNDPGAIGNGTNERDFVRNHIVDRVAKYINATDGHKAVIYDKKRNMYVDTQRPGGGMYDAKKKGYSTVTEYHLDAASASARGGHVIVYSGFAPDKIDLGIRDALQKYVGIRYTHKGHSGISGRNNLLQVNVAANIGVNYRLVELGFITNKADFQAINKNVEALCKAMANAITGGVSKATTAPSKKATPSQAQDKIDPNTKTPRLIGSWKTNKHGTQYIQAEGTFTVGHTKIMSRDGSPFLSAPEGGWAHPGFSIKYDEIVRQNGHVWIGYNQNGKRWYLPYNTWNSRTGAVGNSAWGTFS